MNYPFEQEKQEDPERLHPQKSQTPSWMKALVRAVSYATIVIQMCVCVVGSLVGGFYLDRWWGSSPWLTVGFLSLGCSMGLFLLLHLVRKVERDRRQ